MKKNLFTIGAIVVILILIAVIYAQQQKGSVPTPDYADQTSSPGATPQGKMVTGPDGEAFSGTITAVDTGCFADAVCSVTIDGKKVILLSGMRIGAETAVKGNLVGVSSIGDLEQKIGSYANVYATTTPEGEYTLYGNENFYVEVVEADE